MVLGVAFLKPLQTVLMDFDDLVMAFNHNGHRVLWKGICSTRFDIPSLASIMHDGSTVAHQDNTIAGQIQSTAPIRQQEETILHQMLQSFDDVFAEPQGLPPSRDCDHRIHLKTTDPIAVHPYRYPQLQKNELESQCTKMLEQGIIRCSTSPLSAPVLLVKKHDNTWRFCVDYRALNEATVRQIPYTRGRGAVG
jgi:hypothetical protein